MCSSVKPFGQFETDKGISSSGVVSNQPPVSFQARSERDISHCHWIQLRFSRVRDKNLRIGEVKHDSKFQTCGNCQISDIGTNQVSKFDLRAHDKLPNGTDLAIGARRKRSGCVF